VRLGTTIRSVDGSLPQVERPTGRNATEFVHDYLKDLILDLELTPGTLVTEMDVAKATGLSRTPIREALLRLHEERLVEIFPRRGALVPDITARQVRELYEVRLLLESRAAEMICADQVPVGDSLLPLCDRQESLYNDGATSAELIRADRAFHSRLIALAGNTVMAMLNDSLGDHHQRTGVLSFNFDRHRCVQAVNQHRDIAQALTRFDLAAARSALDKHLVVGEREIERLINR
jgi:DNA-binding GntR family transcriptional regulator